MKSDKIEKIELVITPHASQDAEGTGGVLNLVFDSKKKPGLEGSLGYDMDLHLGSGIFEHYPYLDLGLSTNRFSLSTSIGGQLGGKSSTFSENIIYPSLVRSSDVVNTSDATSKYLDIQTSYQISNSIIFGGVATLSRGETVYDKESNARFSDGRTQFLPSLSNRERDYLHLSAYTDITLDTLGSLLKLSVTNISSPRSSIIRNSSLTQSSSTQDLVRDIVSSQFGYKARSGNMDIRMPINDLDVEAGLKYSHLLNESAIDISSSFNDSAFVVDDANSNVFDYSERIFAAYTSIRGNINNRYSYRVWFSPLLFRQSATRLNK